MAEDAGNPGQVIHTTNGEAAGHVISEHRDHGEKNHHTVGVDAQDNSYATYSRQGTSTPNPFSRKNTSIDLDDYFVCCCTW
jgi:ion channel-forming bestrophin family protein